MTTRVPLRHPNTWIKWKASTKLLCISLTIFIHFQVPKKPVLLKWEDVRYWFLVFLIHAAGYMSAYPERSGPHQRVFNCHQAMVLSGQKSVYVVFLRNEKINLKVIILRFLSPGKKCWYHKIMKRPNFKIITVPNTISLNRPKCLIYHFISDPMNPYLNIFESATFSLPIRLPSTRNRESGIPIRNCLNPLSRVEILF